MANIKKLQMWNSICADARIGVSKSLFGLCTKATFIPTDSPIEAFTAEYSAADGQQLKRILDSDSDKLPKAIGSFQPKSTVNGNFMAEVCASQDGQFLAVQLFQFMQMNYEAVTGVRVFDGENAKALKHLLSE